MKIRSGFVSNSSSSSFTCDVCGRSEVVFDGGGRDAGFLYCDNEHLFCDTELIEPFKEGEYELVSPECCPICMMKVFCSRDLCKFFYKLFKVERETVFAEIKKLNKRRRKLYDNEYVTYVVAAHKLDLDQVVNELRSRFANYDEFRKFLNEK